MGEAFSMNNRLGRRILLYILLCSSFFSLCATMIQLTADYRQDVNDLERRFENIQSSYLESIATSLWDFNDNLVTVQLQGIVNLPDIRYVKITTELGNVYQAGEVEVIARKTVQLPILYGETEIGVLLINADYHDIYQRLRQRAGFIIIAELFKALIIAVCIIFIVHWFVTRHIFRITNYAKRMTGDNLDIELVLAHRPKSKDELDNLVDSLNEMRKTLKSDILKLERAENALIELNSDLEIKVYDRTSKLAEINKQLQQSFDNLTLAKDQLVQSEKMASLGQLVAGVAHEVNTPLGICVTSISAMKEKVDSLKTAIERQELTKAQLSTTLDLLSEYQQIIERSINKAVSLIRGFKSVAVEQHTDPEIKINLAEHVNDIVTTVKTMFKRKNYRLHIDVDPAFEFVTYPSAWNQILTNFLMNSHIHGFEHMKEGDIYINFVQSKGFLTLNYQDTGQGVPEDVRKHIFDPFVTTKRGEGGSGLGLNIVFNLVDVKLKGTVKCVPTKTGCHFEVKVPFDEEQASIVKVV
jgi:signal transduction histidine kinase